MVKPCGKLIIYTDWIAKHTEEAEPFFPNQPFEHFMGKREALHKVIAYKWETMHPYVEKKFLVFCNMVDNIVVN